MSKPLQKIRYGVYAIGSKLGEKKNLMIANTVFQVTSTPKRIAISMNKQNHSYELITESKKFSISILTEKIPIELILKIGLATGKDNDKIKDIETLETENGLPVLDNYTTAYFELRVVDQFDMGTHMLILGNVVQEELVNDEKPMSYDYYRNKKGLTPANAPTFEKK